jgi:hypothetical protein
MILDTMHHRDGGEEHPSDNWTFLLSPIPAVASRADVLQSLSLLFDSPRNPLPILWSVYPRLHQRLPFQFVADWNDLLRSLNWNFECNPLRSHLASQLRTVDPQ